MTTNDDSRNPTKLALLCTEFTCKKLSDLEAQLTDEDMQTLTAAYIQIFASIGIMLASGAQSTQDLANFVHDYVLELPDVKAALESKERSN